LPSVGSQALDEVYLKKIKNSLSIARSRALGKVVLHELKPVPTFCLTHTQSLSLSLAGALRRRAHAPRCPPHRSPRRGLILPGPLLALGHDASALIDNGSELVSYMLQFIVVQYSNQFIVIEYEVFITNAKV
jgi:hypothetical protein